MPTPSYEYKILTRSGYPLPDSKSLGPAGWESVLPGVFDKIIKGAVHDLSVRDGGEWEILSHSSVVHAETLVVTFLIRRALPWKT